MAVRRTSRLRQLPSLALAAVVVLAHAPLVGLYSRRLWELEHYQFAPLLVIAVIALIVARWWTLPRDARRTVLVPATPASVSLVLLTIATWLCSPWLATVSLVVTLGLLLRHFSGPRWRTFLPVWALLVLLIRPPLNLDVQLIQRLQTETSRFASSVLEGLGVAHLMEGNVLMVPGREFMVEEACSGIHSVFALLTAAALYAVWARLPLIRAVPLILSAVVWACLTNLLRVIAIVFADAHFQIDLTSGTAHEVTGFVMFFIAVLFLVLTEQFLQFLLGPIDDDSPATKSMIEWNALARWWNVIARAPAVREIPAESEAPAGSDAGWSHSIGRSIGAVALSVLGVGLALWQVQTLRADDSPDIATGQSLERIDADDLPEDLSGWRRVSFQVERLRDDPLLSEQSKQWIYATPEGSVLVSLDYPFRGWHDLTGCYVGQGWTVLSASGLSMPGGGVDQSMYVTEAILQKPDGQHALLLFTGFDETGEHLANPATKEWWVETLWSLSRRLTRHLADEAPALSPQWRVTTQFQLLMELKDAVPSDDQRRAVRSQFRALCQHIKERLQEKSRDIP